MTRRGRVSVKEGNEPIFNAINADNKTVLRRQTLPNYLEKTFDLRTVLSIDDGSRFGDSWVFRNKIWVKTADRKAVPISWSGWIWTRVLSYWFCIDVFIIASLWLRLYRRNMGSRARERSFRIKGEGFHPACHFEFSNTEAILPRRRI